MKNKFQKKAILKKACKDGKGGKGYDWNDAGVPNAWEAEKAKNAKTKSGASFFKSPALKASIGDNTAHSTPSTMQNLGKNIPTRALKNALHKRALRDGKGGFGQSVARGVDNVRRTASEIGNLSLSDLKNSANRTDIKRGLIEGKSNVVGNIKKAVGAVSSGAKELGEEVGKVKLRDIAGPVAVGLTAGAAAPTAAVGLTTGAAIARIHKKTKEKKIKERKQQFLDHQNEIRNRRFNSI
jgi:hypothetical protein